MFVVPIRQLIRWVLPIGLKSNFLSRLVLVREHRWHLYFLTIFVCHYILIVASQL
jgi:hypothetical protein